MRPWCVCLDFNIVKFADKKTKDNLDHTGMAQFSDFINDMELFDLPFSRSLFSWTDNIKVSVKCRLDCFLISSETIHKFPWIVHKVFPRSLLDHSTRENGCQIHLGGV